MHNKRMLEVCVIFKNHSSSVAPPKKDGVLHCISFMDISINTPALLFPAISLIMLAYTNRFLSLANLVRNLHVKYKNETNKQIIHQQIRNIRYRLKLIKNMQALGVLTFITSIISMYLIYIESMTTAHVFFALSLLSFGASLCFSFIEIQISTKAIEIELSDMEGLDDPSIVEYFKSKFDKEEKEEG